MHCTLEELQDAFVSERITIEQFIEVLIDNFGARRTKKILKHNVRLAIKKQNKIKG